jgi:hypothetical protein
MATLLLVHPSALLKAAFMAESAASVMSELGSKMQIQTLALLEMQSKMLS